MSADPLSPPAQRSSPRPDVGAIKRARDTAAEKVRMVRDAQIKQDQTWLKDAAQSMTADEIDELLRQASATCKETTKVGEQLIVGCPLPKKLQYCVEADPFICPNGRADSAKGCKLSKKASESLREGDACIDGSFVAEAEGGSYLSPYVPWGPISGANQDGTPKQTSGNSSGVTLGTGVDLGAVKHPDAYLARLEAAGVSATTRETIKPFLGKTKADACKALRGAKQGGALVFPARDIELIDLDAMKSRVPQLKSQFKKAGDARLKRLNAQINKEKGEKLRTPNFAKIEDWQKQIEGTIEFKDLTCSQQTVLFSTFYHEGSIGKDHFKPFVDALLAGDDVAAREALVSKSRSAQSLIAARGKRELNFYDGE